MNGSDDLSSMTVLAVHPGAEMFGSDRMFLESVTGLRAAGADVVVTLPTSGPLAARLEDVGASVVVNPAFVLRKTLLRPAGLPDLATGLVRGAVSALRLIGRVRPDVIYVSTIIEPLWPAVGRLRRVPVVSHVHEAEASGSRLVSRALYLPHALSTRIIANSRYTRDAIARVLPSVARRAEIVLNGVEGPQDPTPPRPSIDGPLRVAYAGRLSPRKAPDLVLDAAKILAADGIAVEVTLVGDVFAGYEWFAEELRAKAASMPDVPVQFAGFHADVWPWLAAADVLVVPSREDESFGNTAVEGLLALRPVVVSDMSGLREAAEGYSTVRKVPVDDAVAIAGAVRDLYENWTTVVGSTSASRQEALRRHDPAVYRRGVNGVVRAAAGGTVRRPLSEGAVDGQEEQAMTATKKIETSRTALATDLRRVMKAVVRTASSGVIQVLGTDETYKIADRSTLVISPHPDDETFGCGATIARLRAWGHPVHLLVVTDGRESPRPDGVSLDEMILLRQEETRNALAELGVDGSEVTFWDFHDGTVSEHLPELVDRLVPFMEGIAPEQVMVTSALDRHPDHSTVGLAAREAVSRMQEPPTLLEYPIWQRIPALPFLRRRFANMRPAGGTGPADASARPQLCWSETFLMQKKEAIAAYESQLPHFPAGWVEDFLLPFEHFAEVPRDEESEG